MGLSVLNTGNKFSGHSVLVVEGIEGDKLFVGQYDITATIAPPAAGDAKQDGQATGVINQASIENNFNVKGHINKIRCYESENYSIDYSKFSSKSYRYVPASAAKRMISSIKSDAKRIDENLEKQRYQFLGKNFPWVNSDNGHNCASWVQEKLEIAGIDHGNTKSKPKKVAGSKL